MADEAYIKKLESLQQYIPFLENMITQLKDPKKKNREQQLKKMESLYTMITDKKKKLKLETLTKCEDVLIKLYSKVKPQEKPNQLEAHKYQCRNPPEESKLVIEHAREEKLRLEAARARLNEIATPASPSPPRELFPPNPIVIPTEKVKKDIPKSEDFPIKTWEASFENDSISKKRPDVYSSAAESLKSHNPVAVNRKLVIDDLVVKTDMSKPPIDVADLEMLEDEEDTDKMSLNELEGLRDKLQKELHDKEETTESKQASVKIVVEPEKEKKTTSPVKAPEQQKKDDKTPQKPKIRVEKVIKESDSIFGKALCSIDDKILGEGLDKKKKEKKKEDKKLDSKKSDTSQKKTDVDKKSKDSAEKSKDSKSKQSDKDRHKHKDRKSNSATVETKIPENNKTDDKVSAESEKKADVVEENKNGQPITTLDAPYRRLADKYNPKPKRVVDNAVDKEVLESIEKKMEDTSSIPFLGDNSEIPPFEHSQPKSPLQTIQRILDPRLKQHTFQPPPQPVPPLLDSSNNLKPNVLDTLLEHIKGTVGTLQANNMANAMPCDPFIPSNQFEGMPQSNQFFGRNEIASRNMNNPMMAQEQPMSPFIQQPQHQFHNQFIPPNTFNQPARNTFVNTFIVQHNSMNQNQYGLPKPQGLVMNNFPPQPKKSFNPYEPIAPQTPTHDEYDLSKIPPVDFYSGQGVKQPLQSPPVINNFPNNQIVKKPLLPSPPIQTFPATSRGTPGPTNRSGYDPRPVANRSQKEDRNRPKDERDRNERSRKDSRNKRNFRRQFEYRERNRFDAAYRNRDEDSFTSPLDSLYSGGNEAINKGNAYGMQKFKIPKIRREERPGSRERDFEKRGDRISLDREDRNRFRRDERRSPERDNSSERDFNRRTDSRTSPDKETRRMRESEESGKDSVESETKSKRDDRSVSLDREHADIESAVPNQPVKEEETSEPIKVQSVTDNNKSETAENKEEANAVTNESNDAKDKPVQEEKKASPSEQSILGEFIANLIGNDNKKEVLLQLFSTIADGLSNQQRKKFKRIQRMAVSDSSSSSSDEESDEPRKKKKKHKKKVVSESESSDEEKERVKHKKKKKKVVEHDSKEINKEVKEESEEKAEDTIKPIEIDKNEAEEEEEEKVENVEEQNPEVENKIPFPKKGKKRGPGKRRRKALPKKEPDQKEVNEKPTEDEQVVESVGERIKNRKRNLQKPKKKARRCKTELDMLHEDIKDMFIRDGVLTATGKRMCRILKNDPGALTQAAKKEETPAQEVTAPVTRKKAIKETPVPEEEKPSPKPVKRDVQKDDITAKRLRSSTSNLRVVIEKTDFSKLVPYRSPVEAAPKSAAKVTPEKKGRKRKLETDTDSTTSDASITKKIQNPLPKRDSLRRSAKAQAKYAEESAEEETPVTHTSEEEEDVDLDETPKETKAARKKPKKLRSSWSKGVIKKKNKHANKSDRNSETSTPVSRIHTPVDDIDESNGSSSEDESLDVSDQVVESKDALLIPPDKEYYLNCNSKMKIDCKLCSFKGKVIIQHYKTAHPASEVLISRFSPVVAANVRKDALSKNYDSVEPCDVWEAKGRRKKFNFECVFCQALFSDNTETFYDHVASHTGEFRFLCNVCNYKTSNFRCLRAHNHYLHPGTSITNVKPAWDAPPNYKTVFGYMCTECNYVQLRQDPLKTHVKNYHDGNEDFILKINMSTKDSDAPVKDDVKENLKEETDEAVKVKVKVEKEDEDIKQLQSVYIKQEAEEEPEDASKDVGEAVPTQTEFALNTLEEPEVQNEQDISKPDEASKEKDADLNVFTCNPEVDEEEQKIEEERKKLMEEINEQVKSSRTLNFVDRLKTKLEEQLKIAASNPLDIEKIRKEEQLNKLSEIFQMDTEKLKEHIKTAVAETDAVTPLKPTQTKRASPRAKSAVKTKKAVEKSTVPKVDVTATFISKNNAPIGSTIQRLQGNLTVLTEVPKLPPLTHISELIPARSPLPPVKEQVFFNDGFKVMKMNDKVLYCCCMPACVVATDVKSVFRNHCKNSHSKTGPNKCGFCSQVFHFIAEYFDHVTNVHWEKIIPSEKEKNEVSPTPILRMRRLSGDLLSEAKSTGSEEEEKDKPQEEVISMDESSGFPFKIASVSSQDENSDFPFTIASVSSQVDDDNLPFHFEITNVISLASDDNGSPIKSTDSPTEGALSSIPPPPPLTPIHPNTSPTKVLISNIQNLIQNDSSSFQKLDSVASKSSYGSQKVVLKDHPMPVLDGPRKDPKALAEMIKPQNIIHLYKCPSFRCSYSTHQRNQFELHLNTHPELKEGPVRCVYCNYGNRLEHIIIHIDVRHGKSLFSCAYCLFRAVNQSYVQIHEAAEHKGKPPKVYRVPWNVLSQGVKGELSKPKLKDLLKPTLFPCGVQSCGQTFVVKDQLETHLNTVHSDLETVKCPSCTQYTASVAIAKGVFHNYVEHLVQEHPVGKYLCRYCKYSSNCYRTIYTHLAAQHYSVPLDIILREYYVDKVGRTGSNKQAKCERLMHLNTEPTEFVNPKYLQRLAVGVKLKTVLKKSSPGSHTVEAVSPTKPTTPTKPVEENKPIILNRFLGMPKVPESTTKSSPLIIYDEPLVNLLPNSGTEDVDPLSLDNEPNMEMQEETTKEGGEDSFSIVNPSFNDESDSLDTDVDAVNDDEVPVRLGIKKEGYTGERLFKCVKCDLGFPSSTRFRLHLNKCVMTSAGSSTKPFSCYHCGRPFKMATTLIDHIRTHGTVKFSCSLCDFKNGNHLVVRTHMKLRHKVSNMVVTPADPKLTDMDKDHFIIRPRVKRKSVDESGPKQKKETSAALEETELKQSQTSFLPSEIDLLPRQAIFSSELKCLLCNYTTKVRTNLVRHLEFHAKEKDVPTTAPVNPVPCLEKNEKMFDKMTNLALSSFTNTTRTGVERTLSKEEEAQLPAFIPLTKRYVCGASNCNYLCLDESLLRHHLVALHADENTYRCKHCEQVLSVDKTINVDQVMKHFKLHELHLYKCGYCRFVHNLKHKVERHVSEQHLDKGMSVIVVREMDAEPIEGGPTFDYTKEVSFKEAKPWHCCMCRYRTVTREEMVYHAENKHDIDEQYKCALCTYKNSSKDTFTSHFSDKHPGHEIDVIDVFYKRDDLEQNKKGDGEPFDTTPLWQRNKDRVRHIRGILFDESGKIPKKSLLKTTTVPTMDNLDRAIEAVASGSGQEQISEPKVAKAIKGEIVKKPPNLKKESLNARRENITKSTNELIARIGKAIKENTDKVRYKRKRVDNDVIVVDEEESKSVDEDESKENEGEAQVQGDELMGTFGPFGEPFNNKYLCPLCAKMKTRNPQQMRHHLYDELQYRRYKCKICDKTAFNYNFFHKHFNKRHGCDLDPEQVEESAQDKQIELWVEKVLAVQGKMLSERKDKIEIISDDDVLCVDDEIPPTTTTVLDSNSQEVTSSSSGSASVPSSPKKIYKCQHCDLYQSKSQSDVRRHEMRHWLQKPLKCGYCDYEGIRNSEIMQHSRSKHKNLEVNIVSVPMPSTPTIIPIVSLNRPKRKSKTTGDPCSSSGSSWEDVVSKKDEEVVSIISDTEPESEPQLNEVRTEHLCTQCHMSFDTRELLEEHFTVAHSDPDVTVKARLKQFKCTLCEHTSNSYLSITRDHIWWHFKPFKCPYCLKRMISPTLANNHISRLHPKERCVYEVLEDERAKAEQAQVLELQPDSTYGPLIKKSRLNFVKREDSQKSYTARKRTSPVAKKSTTKQSQPEGFSYYKCKPDELDLKKISTTLSINNTQMSMNLEQLSHIFQIFPEVRVEDCMKTVI